LVTTACTRPERAKPKMRAHKILCTVLDETHELLVEKAIETLAQGP